MKASLFLALLGVCMFATAADAKSSDDPVRAPLRSYLMGHATGDASHMRKAFLPTAHIEGIREGKFVSWSLDEYCARFTGKPANDEASRRRTIDHVDVSGDAAMARATLVHGATTFTDYFVLLKVGGEWKIANKVYAARPTAE
jgi:Putative lumazine-binding